MVSCATLGSHAALNGSAPRQPFGQTIWKKEKEEEQKSGGIHFMSPCQCLVFFLFLCCHHARCSLHPPFHLL